MTHLFEKLTPLKKKPREGIEECGCWKLPNLTSVGLTETMVFQWSWVLVIKAVTQKTPKIAQNTSYTWRTCTASSRNVPYHTSSHFDHQRPVQYIRVVTFLLQIISQKDEHCWVGELNGLRGKFDHCKADSKLSVSVRFLGNHSRFDRKLMSKHRQCLLSVSW